MAPVVGGENRGGGSREAERGERGRATETRRAASLAEAGIDVTLHGMHVTWRLAAHRGKKTEPGSFADRQKTLYRDSSNLGGPARFVGGPVDTPSEMQSWRVSFPASATRTPPSPKLRQACKEMGGDCSGTRSQARHRPRGNRSCGGPRSRQARRRVVAAGSVCALADAKPAAWREPPWPGGGHPGLAGQEAGLQRVTQRCPLSPPS